MKVGAGARARPLVQIRPTPGDGPRTETHRWRERAGGDPAIAGPAAQAGDPQCRRQTRLAPLRIVVLQRVDMSLRFAVRGLPVHAETVGRDFPNLGDDSGRFFSNTMFWLSVGVNGWTSPTIRSIDVPRRGGVAKNAQPKSARDFGHGSDTAAHKDKQTSDLHR